jgi:hypothetical protein
VWYGSSLWPEFDDDYIRTILMHAKAHSDTYDEIEQQLQRQLQEHLKKQERWQTTCRQRDESHDLKIKERFDLYTSLRENLGISTQEAVKIIAACSSTSKLKGTLGDRCMGRVCWIHGPGGHDLSWS